MQRRCVQSPPTSGLPLQRSPLKVLQLVSITTPLHSFGHSSSSSGRSSDVVLISYKKGFSFSFWVYIVVFKCNCKNNNNNNNYFIWVACSSKHHDHLKMNFISLKEENTQWSCSDHYIVTHYYPYDDHYYGDVDCVFESRAWTSFRNHPVNDHHQQ